MFPAQRSSSPPCPALPSQTHQTHRPSGPLALVWSAQPALNPITHTAAAMPRSFLLTKPISAALFLSRCFLASLARPDVSGSGVPGPGPCSPASVPGKGLCVSSQADVLGPRRSPRACSVRASRRALRLLSASQPCPQWGPEGVTFDF